MSKQKRPTQYKAILTCIQCKVDFTGRAGSKFCTPACNNAANVARNIGAEKNCMVCAKIFTGRKGSTFCSDVCRDISNDKDKTDKRAAKLFSRLLVAHPTNIKSCDECNTDFSPTIKLKKWCSIGCRTISSGKTQKNKADKNLKIKTCKECNIVFKGRKGSSFCCKICKNKHDLKQQHIDAVEKYQSVEEYVICPVCSLRMGQISSVHMKIHGMTIPEIKILYPDQKLLSVNLSMELSKRVEGDKNPGFKHGGRLSPFSSKFLKYNEFSNVETKEIVEKLFVKSINTRNINDNNSTRLSYYTSRGMSELDSEIALHNRQTTFSLEKCINDYGDELGTLIWADRQANWQNTLNSKSDEEKDLINSKKSSKVNYRSLWSQTLDSQGYFYIIEIYPNVVKIGVTSKSDIRKRYNIIDLKNTNILLFEKCHSINHAFQIEQLLKRKNKLLINNSDYGAFGWTEVFNNIDTSVILNEALIMLNNPDSIAIEFNNVFKLKNGSI
jgi:predicted nucleic acid-binding Zn ribbon protein